MFQIYLDSLLALQGWKLLLALLFVTFFIARFIYLFVFTGRVLFRKKIVPVQPVPVSLFITVRNEEDRLRANLPPILSINGVNFEVIVIDDVSQDNTFQVLGMMKERSDRLKTSMLHQETRYSVKMAQNIALKASGYDWVLQVPISYENASYDWISGISSALADDKNVVIGYLGAQPKRGIASRFYQIENFLQFSKSVSYILNGLPFVYSEENVAFRKKKYFEIGGHALKINEPFANLELLINHFIKKSNTTVLFNTTTSIKKTEDIVWKDYFDLLKKSIRIEKHLSTSKKMMLVIDEFLVLMYIPFLAIVTVLLFEIWPFIAALMVIQLTSKMIIVKMLQNRLKERRIFITSLMYELAMPYFKFFFRWMFNQRGHKQKWKIKV